MDIVRANGKGANHAVEPEDLTVVAYERWLDLYQKRELGGEKFGDVTLLSLTYCLGYEDPRRIFGVYDAGGRCLYPIWWDQHHEVSGRDGRPRKPPICVPECCHPDRAET